MKNLVSHGAVLDNIQINLPTKDARLAHLPTSNIKTSVDDAMAQVTSAAAKVGSISATRNQLVTTGAGGRLDSMHHNLNIVYQ